MNNIKYKECRDDDCSVTFPQYNSMQKYCSGSCKAKNEKKKSKPRNITPKPYSGINDHNVDKEIELYHSIWEERDHVSYLSGKPLVREGSSFWHNQFAHVLAKGKAKYPKFKLFSKNIILLTPEEHNLLDFCSESDREKYGVNKECSWKKVYEYKESLIKEYKLLYGN